MGTQLVALTYLYVMQLYYLPEATEGLVELPEAEARHAIQVLRHGVGDTLDLVDGRGGWYRGTIVGAGKRNCQLQLERQRQEERRAPRRITVGIGPTKQVERFEWFLEKATELGVDRIVPLLCAHNERRRLRLDRAEKVLVAAMKQSLQAWLPQIDELTPFADFVATAGPAARFIAWIDETVTQHLVHTYHGSEDVVLLIGPEGDFAPAEVALARDNGFTAVSLGSNRLRTETAGIAAVHTVNLAMTRTT